MYFPSFRKHRKHKKGSDHPASKLTWPIVRAIREEHSQGGVTHTQLAEKYKVSKGQIGRIVRNEAWIEGEGN